VELISVRRAAALFYFQLERTNPYRKALDRELTKLLVDRYRFLKFPQTYEEFNDQSQGVTFADGVFDGVAIQELKFFFNGVLIATGESTDVAERLFADMMTAWPEVGLVWSDDFVTNRAYASTLVVHSDIDLLAVNQTLWNIANSTFQRKPVGFGGISFYTEGNTDVVPPVRIERLQGAPLTAMQFWSQAPIQTTSHVEFITAWEQALR
jgi:hypothetical protein